MDNNHEPSFETGLDTTDDRGVATIVAVNALNKLLVIPRKISAIANELNAGLGNTRY